VTSPPVPSSQCDVFTRSESQGQGPSHGRLSHATRAGGVERRVAHCVVGDSVNDEDRHVAPELSQPLVWTCDMRHVTGQWASECEMCNDSRDVMWVSESISRRSINRWRTRAVCQGGPASQKWGQVSGCLLQSAEDRGLGEMKGASDKERGEWVWDGDAPTPHKAKDGGALGRWVGNQRSAKDKGTLGDEREE